jgi:hypothetical protein
VDVLTAFGWRASRQNPITCRPSEANVLQPAILANGTLGTWMTRLSDAHALSALCLQDSPVDILVARIFLRLLTRLPSAEERQRYIDLLSPGYESRIVTYEPSPPPRRSPEYVTWSNHLNSEANRIALRLAREAQDAYPSTNRLRADWRDRAEDMVWALVNSPEMVHYP